MADEPPATQSDSASTITDAFGQLRETGVSRRGLLGGAFSAAALGVLASASGATPFFGAASSASAGITNGSLLADGVPRYRYAWPYGYDVLDAADSVQHRFGKIYSGTNYHTGDDFNLGLDKAKVPAVTAGVVVQKLESYDAFDSNEVLGFRIVVRGYDGIYTTYCHLKGESTLLVGDIVDIGDSVGVPGGSNGSNEPYGTHVHLVMSTSKAHSRNGQFGTASNQSPSTGQWQSENLINPAQYIRANLNSPVFTEVESDPVPNYDSFNLAQTTPVSSSWGSLLIATGPNVASFIEGPKRVDVSANVIISGLGAGERLLLRIARIDADQQYLDNVGAVSVTGYASGLTYANISGVANLGTDKFLKLQASTTATGVTVTSVSVKTLSWDLDL